MEKTKDIDDKRWGGYVPWFYRNADFVLIGDYFLFFARLSGRVYQLIYYNETDIPNLNYFFHNLESKSLQRFKVDEEERFDSYAEKSCADQISKYFDKASIELRAKVINVSRNDILVRSMGELNYVKPEDRDFVVAFSERVSVLEDLLRLLPANSPAYLDFINDIRRYFAEAGVSLDIDKDTKTIIPLEEPLLQKEVVDKLLPRLYSKFPDLARELVDAYHSMLNGDSFDIIFLNAFKTLEEIARQMTGYDKFEFDDNNLKKYFPAIHSTIRITITKLNAHRGDKGGHGKTSPEPYEMRYLLFCICNVALLLLDYPDSISGKI
jgi:hypothetical protein